MAPFNHRCFSALLVGRDIDRISETKGLSIVAAAGMFQFLPIEDLEETRRPAVLGL